MRVYDNGVYREMTQEEIESFKAHTQEQAEEPTLEERLEAVEAVLLEQFLGGLDNV
jgi:hypothetical protein